MTDTAASIVLATTMNDGSSLTSPTTSNTGVTTDAVLEDARVLLCDRCHQVVDDHNNIPIQSRACEHSCCSRCLESMAQGAVTTTSTTTTTSTVVDCYQCEAPNAFDAAQFHRHRNLMACSIYKVMIQREEYWRRQAKQWQGQAQKLQEQVSNSSPNASTTTTTNQKIAAARHDDTSTNNTNNSNSNTNTTVAAVAKTHEQYHIPGVAFLSSSVTPFMEGDSIEEEERKKNAEQVEKDNAIALLTAAATKAVSTSSDPPLVWVDYLSLRRRAYLLAVEGTEACIRWEIGAKDDLRVDLAMVHRFSYPEECVRNRPLSIPTGTMSHGRPIQRKLYLQPPSSSLISPSREQKIPLDSDDSPPFRVNPTGFIQGNTWDHGDTDEDDSMDGRGESKSPRRRGRPPKRPRGRPPKNSNRSGSQETRPAKRPRGRPPKNNNRSGSQETRPAKRPRGRPPKNNNRSPAKRPRVISSKEKRPRGRPRKHPIINGDLGQGSAAAANATKTETGKETAQSPKRPRGRPPKNRLDAPAPRPRGRPRKHPVQATLQEGEPVEPSIAVKGDYPADMTIDHNSAEQPSPPLVNVGGERDEAVGPQGVGPSEVKATEEPESAAPGMRGPGRPRKHPVQVTLNPEEPTAPVTRGPGLLKDKSREEQSAAAVKRGPGRPRKSSASPSPVKRGPGRPRKSQGDNAPVGLPSKPQGANATVRGTEKDLKEPAHQQLDSPRNHSATDAPVKRGPGQPKKVPLVSTTVQVPEEQSVAAVKRGPGRPKKVPLDSTAAVQIPEEQSAAAAKRGRGRPRKAHVGIIAEQGASEEAESPAIGATLVHASGPSAETALQVLEESCTAPAVDGHVDGVSEQI